MSAAHCRRNGPWTAGAGSAIRTQQRQVMDSKKQDSHPQYNSWAQDYDYMVLTIEGRFRKGFNLLANHIIAEILKTFKTAEVIILTLLQSTLLIQALLAKIMANAHIRATDTPRYIYQRLCVKMSEKFLDVLERIIFGVQKCLKIEPQIKMSERAS